MSSYPNCIERLISELSRLPGIGRRSAERLAFHVVEQAQSDVNNLSEALVEAKTKIRTCNICHSICEDSSCSICNDQSRNTDVLCVVGHARDVFALERGSIFRGRYHVLGGVISPLSGVEPEDLNIDSLFHRLEKEGTVKEVLLALNPSTEGETTSIYIAHILRPLKLKVSRIAYGLPVGGELEFSDPVTLSRAIDGRRDL
jgi:recombination protein RecR